MVRYNIQLRQRCIAATVAIFQVLAIARFCRLGTPDLRSPKAGKHYTSKRREGEFIVMKTGTHASTPASFQGLGIEFEEGFAVSQRKQRKMFYASRNEPLLNINEKFQLYVGT